MTHDNTEAVRLPYRDWVTILEAIDVAREDLLATSKLGKAGSASRAALQAAADRYTLVGEDLGRQLEPNPEWPDDSHKPQDAGLEFGDEIPDPRDAVETPTRRGKRKNGPLANL